MPKQDLREDPCPSSCMQISCGRKARCLTPKDREGPSNRAMIILELVGEIFLPLQLQVARYDNVVVELRRDTNLAVASTGAKKKMSDNDEHCTRSHQRQKKLSSYLLKVHSNRAQSVILAQGHRVRFWSIQREIFNMGIFGSKTWSKWNCISDTHTIQNYMCIIL